MWVATNLQYAALFPSCGHHALGNAGWQLRSAAGSAALFGYLVPLCLSVYGIYGVGYLAMMTDGAKQSVARLAVCRVAALPPRGSYPAPRFQAWQHARFRISYSSSPILPASSSSLRCSQPFLFKPKPRDLVMSSHVIKHACNSFPYNESLPSAKFAACCSALLLRAHALWGGMARLSLRC